MLQMIDSADDVIALKIAHKITGDDLDTVMDRLDDALATQDKVHIFVETHAIDDIAVGGMASYMMRAMPLLGKLDRFGRVAVVADQSWVRIAAKIESAILPHIRYRTFEPEQRDRAFAWVTGDADE